jgi:hypothetical protein
MGDVIPADLLHGRIVRDQLQRIEHTAEEVTYHDDLDAGATAFMLHEVAEAAAAHGLKYLGDANFGYSQLVGLPEALVRFVEQIPERRAMEREQYVDFVVGRSFRRTLLVHDEAALDRHVSAAAVRDFLVAGRLTPSRKGIDPLAAGPVEFRAATGRTLVLEDAFDKAAATQLTAAWPGAVSFTELLQSALAQLARRGIEAEPTLDPAERLSELLFRCYAARQVELHLEPPSLVTTPSERPEASLLARRQIEAGPIITNLRHARVVLEDPVARRFLVLVDGTRTLDQLVDDLNAQLAGDGGTAAPQDMEPLVVTREQVEDNLRILARLALLVR